MTALPRASTGRLFNWPARLWAYTKRKAVASESKPAKKKEGKKQQASGSLFFNLLISIIGPILVNLTKTEAVNKMTSPCLVALDIGGYNYGSVRYAIDGKKHPNRVLVGSETMPHEI